MKLQRLLAVSALALGTVAATAGAAGTAAAAGVTGPDFYVNHQLFRTVGTPTDFSNTGAPASSFELMYDFGGAQPNVAAAAPGDLGFKGGRWMVHALSFPDGYSAALASGDADHDGVLDSLAEVNTALAAGTAIDAGVVKQFECPVIPLPANTR